MKPMELLILAGVGIAAWYFLMGPGASATTTTTTGGNPAGAMPPTQRIVPIGYAPPRTTGGTPNTTSYTGTGGQQAVAGSAGSFAGMGDYV